MSSVSTLPSLGSLPDLGGGTSATPASADTGTQGPDWLTGKLAQYVTIIIGLILIVVGLFSFKEVRTATGYAAKAGAAAA